MLSSADQIDHTNLGANSGVGKKWYYRKFPWDSSTATFSTDNATDSTAKDAGEDLEFSVY